MTRRCVTRRHLTARRVILALVLAAGTALAAKAAWIPAKARVAQVLLHRAWARAAAGEAQPRPWPWADTWPVARLRVPALGIDEIVLSGATGSALAFGPGHALGTAAPGTPGNAVVAGHRDTHLAFLRDAAPGTRVLVERPDGRVVEHVVADARVTDRTDSSVLRDHGDDRLTLVTCWPLGALQAGGPERLVVTALTRSSPPR